MIEVSFTEIALFAWASLMTMLYARAKHEERKTRFVLMHFIEDADARNQVVRGYEEFKKKVGN